MDPKLANRIVYALEVLAIMVAAYVCSDVLSVLLRIHALESPIEFDSGLVYLMMMLIFPWLHGANIAAKKWAFTSKQLTIPTIVFFGILVLGGWGSSTLVIESFYENGYRRCPNSTESFRISAGEFAIFTLSESECLP